jgi:chitinase
MSGCFQTVVRIVLLSIFFSLTLAPGQNVKAPISVVVNPPEVTVHVGQVQKFTAVVKGADRDGIRWGVDERDGGQITEDGMYTAPATSGIYHVLATSKANPSARSVAKVTVVTESDDPRQ